MIYGAGEHGWPHPDAFNGRTDEFAVAIFLIEDTIDEPGVSELVRGISSFFFGVSRYFVQGPCHPSL